MFDQMVYRFTTVQGKHDTCGRIAVKLNGTGQNDHDQNFRVLYPLKNMFYSALQKMVLLLEHIVYINQQRILYELWMQLHVEIKL